MSSKWRLSWLAGLLAVAPAAASAAPVEEFIGIWVTEKDEGTVAIVPCEDAASLCGYIYSIDVIPDYVKLEPGEPLVDGYNPNPRLRSRPICGLQILGDLRPLGGETWGKGWAYEPRNGKTYGAQITLSGKDELSVRGYVGIPKIGRTLVWKRPPDDPEAVIERCTPPEQP